MVIFSVDLKNNLWFKEKQVTTISKDATLVYASGILVYERQYICIYWIIVIYTL